MKTLTVASMWICLMVFTVASPGTAVDFDEALDLGGFAGVHAGFYECKVNGANSSRVSEDTLLAIVNGNPVQGGEAIGPLGACIVLFDGNENLLGAWVTGLSRYDLDEINLCTLATPEPVRGTPGRPPEGGVVMLVTFVDQTPRFIEAGAYAWIKNVLYTGAKAIASNPYSAQGFVGAGKTQLQGVPISDTEPIRILWRECNPQIRVPEEAFVEGTFEMRDRDM
jgi:hypothetical protein